MKIEAEILPVSIEIDGAMYRVAAKTITVSNRLAQITAQSDLPKYQVWLDQLRIILGDAATAELFPDGENENLDRLEHIHAEVMVAFDYNGQRLRVEREKAEADRLRDMAATLTTILGAVREITGKYPGVMRPQKEA